MADYILVLDDPDGHFPYARERAEQAGTPAEVADWCERVVHAQDAARRDPSPETAQALQDVMRAAQEFNRHRRAAQDSQILSDGDAAVHPETVNGEVQ